MEKCKDCGELHVDDIVECLKCQVKNLRAERTLLINVHKGDIQDYERACDERDAALGQVTALAKQCSELENDREYNAELVKERDEKIAQFTAALEKIGFQRVTALAGGDPLEPIPDYGDHMPLGRFIKNVKDGGFIDDDGTGYYATATQMTRIEALPSEIKRGQVNHKYTHVVWFNK